MTDLVEAVERTILGRRLLRPRQAVLVGVSGGLDSMVLLTVLDSLSAHHRWRLVVAHFNHRLRGAESDADELFVRDTAGRLGWRFARGAADAAAFARREGISLEMAARKLRHDFLARAAGRLRIKTVALAHHADDQVELFFVRLLRGAGGEGLSGMKWSAPSPCDPAVALVRPLLDQSKAALTCFAEQQGIAFREDATNQQHDFLRNRIRNKLLPLLSEKYQPALARSILRTMEVVGSEADFVRRAAEKWLGQTRRGDFEKLHPAVQRQALQMQLIEMNVRPQFDLVEQLRVAPDRAVTLGPGRTVSRDGFGSLAKSWNARSAFRSSLKTVEFNGAEGAFQFGGLKITWQIRSGGRLALRKLKFTRGHEYFDADKIGRRIVLRHWRPGDRFQPIGMRAGVKLQDLFVNQKISRAQRHQLVMATTAAGEPFWVEGLRMAERFKLDNRTVRRLKWRWVGR